MQKESTNLLYKTVYKYTKVYRNIQKFTKVSQKCLKSMQRTIQKYNKTSDAAGF